MKYKWLYYIGCLIVPHIMLAVGIIILLKPDIGLEKKSVGKKICLMSTIVLFVGSLIYYIFFTPMFGLD